MATKAKKTTKTQESETKITRIRAKDDAAVSKAKDVKTSAVTAESIDPLAPTKTKNPFKALGRYFKGAWYELKQVRWPTRRATWSMTLAVLAYTAFFVVVILLLDALFKYLFELMLG